MGYLITLVIIIAVPVVLVQYSTGMSAGYSAAAAVGIVVALISLSILRSKLKRAARRKSLIGKYGSEDLVEMIMDQKIWKGMTSDQLLDSLGKPESVDQEMSARRAREVWKYDRIGENRYRNRVTVDNGQVSAWTAKGQ
jgi:hypothetical protein